MAYHIAEFVNNGSYEALTANPKADRDTYFVETGSQVNPSKRPLINKNGTGTDWNNYQEAFGHANFIYTGSETWCFWDNGESKIFGLKQGDSNPTQLYDGGATNNLRVTINKNNDLSFAEISNS